MKRFIQWDINEVLIGEGIEENDNITKIPEDKIVVKLIEDIGYGNFIDDDKKQWMFDYDKEGNEFIGIMEENSNCYYKVDERLDDCDDGTPKWVILDSHIYNQVDTDDDYGYNYVLKNE